MALESLISSIRKIEGEEAKKTVTFLKVKKKSVVISWLVLQILICPVTRGNTSQLPNKDLDTIIITLFDTKGENGVNRTENTSNLVVDFIQNKVKHFARQLDLLSKIASKDNATLQILKADYEEELTQIQALIGNLKLSPNEGVSSIADYLDNMLIESQEDTDALITQLIAEKEGVLKLCISKIKSDEITSANSEFQKLGNDSLPDVIKRAYNHDMLNIPKVLKFIKTFDCQQQEVATGLLLDLVTRDGHLLEPEIFYFYGINEKCENVSLINELDVYALSIISSKLFINKSDFLPNALNFINRFPEGEVSAKMVIYTLLYELMKKNNDLWKKELVELAYNVRMLDKYCKLHPDQCKQTEPKLDSFKRRLPSGVKALLWNEYVLISTNEHPRYYLTERVHQVFLYSRPNIYKNQLWKIIPVEDGRYFEIRSFSDQDLVLYASGKKYARELLLGHYAGEERLWKVVPHHDTDQLFYLKNKLFDEAIDSDVTCSSSNPGLCNRVYVRPFLVDNKYQLWFLQ